LDDEYYFNEEANAEEEERNRQALQRLKRERESIKHMKLSSTLPSKKKDKAQNEGQEEEDEEEEEEKGGEDEDKAEFDIMNKIEEGIGEELKEESEREEKKDVKMEEEVENAELEGPLRLPLKRSKCDNTELEDSEHDEVIKRQTHEWNHEEVPNTEEPHEFQIREKGKDKSNMRTVNPVLVHKKKRTQEGEQIITKS
jgi:hypothetical protein